MHRFVRLVGAVLVAMVVVAGCSLVAPPVAAGPLVTVELRGGECPEGACQSLVAIERDGRVHRLEPEAAEIDRLSAEAVAALAAAIDSTDFGAIRSRPFTGECPVNFDGQEVIYEFRTGPGTERIASCEVEIDPAAPLFRLVDEAVGG